MRVRYAKISEAELEMNSVLVDLDLFHHLGFKYTEYLPKKYICERQQKEVQFEGQFEHRRELGDQYVDPIYPTVVLSEQCHDDTSGDI